MGGINCNRPNVAHLSETSQTEFREILAKYTKSLFRTNSLFSIANTLVEDSVLKHRDYSSAREQMAIAHAVAHETLHDFEALSMKMDEFGVQSTVNFADQQANIHAVIRTVEELVGATSTFDHLSGRELQETLWQTNISNLFLHASRSLGVAIRWQEDFAAVSSRDHIYAS